MSRVEKDLEHFSITVVAELQPGKMNLKPGDQNINAHISRYAGYLHATIYPGMQDTYMPPYIQVCKIPSCHHIPRYAGCLHATIYPGM